MTLKGISNDQSDHKFHSRSYLFSTHVLEELVTPFMPKRDHGLTDVNYVDYRGLGTQPDCGNDRD